MQQLPASARREQVTYLQTETHLAGSLLPASLCLLLNLASLLLLKLANETRTVLLNQAHLDSPVMGF